MAAWRMAMRGRIHPADGSWLEPPREMWPHCRELGVAAITYGPVQDDDLAAYSEQALPQGWTKLAPAQRESLKRFVFDVHVGDVIYVKEGPEIVCKGTVLGGYQFDLAGAIPGALGTLWRHQRRVRWSPDFRAATIAIGNPQIVTLVPLTPEDVARVERTQAS